MEVIGSGVAKRKRKLTALPLLVVLFVFSYCLLTRLVIDQDRMIDAQGSMIHSLLRDNISLSKYHKHATALPRNSRDRNDLQVEFPAPAVTHSGTHAQSGKASSNQVELNQFPSAQVLNNQVPHNQAPSNQVLSNEVQSKSGPQTNSKTNHKVRKPAQPATPPAPLTDPSDMRRATFSI
jgi:hypothetical protein